MSIDDGITIRLENSSIDVKNVSKLIHVEEITPNVIEPSFGISRILYAVLEHSFRKRDNDANSYFALPASIAAHKCSILPLINNKGEFQPYIKKICRFSKTEALPPIFGIKLLIGNFAIPASKLIDDEISHKIDDNSGSIGRRYVRNDEIGIPFSITIDYDTPKIPNTVTIRERDTKEQLRIPLDVVSKVIRDLSSENVTWNQLKEKYPKLEKHID